MKPKDKGTLRASELAELAGVSLPTIKHYVNEGLIPKPVKTGKTMAYYDETCVRRIKLIKKLQKEKFLPLDVIKRVIDSESADKEELELGSAILKSHTQAAEFEPVSESDVERHTQYPLSKIHLLEQEGLVFPASEENGRYYDAVDCKIIELMRKREACGVSFDYSLETVRIYRDAIKRAVLDDIHLFARTMFGDISTRETVRFITEADDLLDDFVVLFREKMRRSFGRAAIKQMNDLPGNLAILSFLPVKGEELPEAPPQNPLLKVVYFFCTGDYGAVSDAAGDAALAKNKPPYTAFTVIARLLRGDTKAALKIVEQCIPRPTARALDNAAAALAYTFSVGEAAGFSSPIYLAKKALLYLKRIEIARETTGAGDLFARYVCGAIYTLLPDVLDMGETGLNMLARIERLLKTRRVQKGRLPAWLARTLDFEILPALELRVNRLLAEGCLRRGNYEDARSWLDRIIEMADADDELSRWARMKKIEHRDRKSTQKSGI